MLIENRWNTTIGSTIKSRKVPVSTDDESDFLDDIVAGSSQKSFKSFAPNAPQNVKTAWDKAAKQTGTDGFGTGSNGMMTHIPIALVIQMEQKNSTGNSDLFGNTVSSAKETTQNILARLDTAISNESNSTIRNYHSKDKQFYESFLKNLGDEGAVSAYERWNYRI